MTFAERVYEVTSGIPRGKVATYGDIAAKLGIPGASRAVGNALHKNPRPVIVPCHRVVNSKGCLALHFGSPGGIDRQRELLTVEGVIVKDYKVDLSEFRAKL